MDSVGTRKAHPWGPTGHQPTVIAGVGGNMLVSWQPMGRPKGSKDSNEVFRVNGVNETTGNLAVGKAGMHN